LIFSPAGKISAVQRFWLPNQYLNEMWFRSSIRYCIEFWQPHGPRDPIWHTTLNFLYSFDERARSRHLLAPRIINSDTPIGYAGLCSELLAFA
jgi:hypothetical protein